ncbi:malate dehydrogenase [Angomonas deanei]|uniref:malate dehydrogenase n=1 Tax=Angomonas deanei TaxID=59799 RepID=S9WVQ2_9TRYP|nr:malate dehydrogenase [Angomonas deanei]EPY37736.1 malate dehydrogenase [Angomonas deanei]EPY42522.1 malate dehydrogenase [Angomonas deanei]EPY43556.1 malate dehydrogenase [Angomonas deanei]CAD2216972.1 lactate/malate dehydrogenase, NAD binding domain/lactate/malate dehydrogenase, alpha/beta C-terminal domain containing protein, putative [Angomonas deanei]|eukprot:EPY33042.1 malate dehydrogenase [Angomonas deanei]
MFNIFRKKTENKVGKVVVFGASSAVGQSLSMLLKLSPHVKELVCCNTPLDASVPSVGVAADVSHIDTNTKVRYAQDVSDWPAALHSAQFVAICCGVNFDPLREFNEAAFAQNAPYMKPVIQAIAESAPSAVIGVVSSPVNSIVPLCAEYLKAENKFDPRKLLGITTLDVVRARRLAAEALSMNPFDVNIPVVGGRGGITACPLISQTGLRLSTEDIAHIAIQVQQYGTSLHHTDEQTGDKSLTTSVSPSGALGSAYATHELIMSVLKAQRGDYGICECAMVESTVRAETPFFASKIQLGREGVESLFPIGNLNEFEQECVDTAAKEVAKDVGMALTYYKNNK